nr:dihydroorotate dehydrogenase electron transfer subunit [Eubacterium sp.]
LVRDAVPGQFVSVYSNMADRMLPRPISICDVDKEDGTLRLVYRVVGAGTEEFSHLKEGDSVKVLGPLGNGYTIEDGVQLLFGGGIGIPPMLYLAKTLFDKGVPKEKLHVILGYRDETFLLSEFENIATVHISSDMGTVGRKGNVVELAVEEELTGDIIYACGPKPMLRALGTFAEERAIKAEFSLEERMACGVGACLACVCESKEVDDHSNVHNRRVCADGPVFLSTDVVI